MGGPVAPPFSQYRDHAPLNWLINWIQYFQHQFTYLFGIHQFITVLTPVLVFTTHGFGITVIIAQSGLQRTCSAYSDTQVQKVLLI